jgi:hypothetical protein
MFITTVPPKRVRNAFPPPHTVLSSYQWSITTLDPRITTLDPPLNILTIFFLNILTRCIREEIIPYQQ